jgi:hypothetical protein
MCGFELCISSRSASRNMSYTQEKRVGSEKSCIIRIYKYRKLDSERP